MLELASIGLITSCVVGIWVDKLAVTGDVDTVIDLVFFTFNFGVMVSLCELLIAEACTYRQIACSVEVPPRWNRGVL